jgi:CheY-like chemotaxis protein
MITKNSKNILLADDSSFFRLKLSTILSEAGHRVTFASDGREVIKKIQANPDGIDLLILDLLMPHIDGFAVLEWMKENGHLGRFPVLAVTGVYEPGEVVGRLTALGADGFMTKAFPPEEIVYRINRLLFSEKTDERSADKRIPISVPVDYTVNDTSYTGFILNISTTGIFLHTMIGILPETVVRLKFSLPGSDMVFDIEGIVKWSTSLSTSKGLFIGAGIKFASLTEEESETEKRFIEEEIKRRSLDR